MEVTPRLSVLAGVRWDMNTAATEVTDIQPAVTEHSHLRCDSFL